jgi:hypothetical protein
LTFLCECSSWNSNLESTYSAFCRNTKKFTLCKFLEGVFNTVVSVWCCYCSKSLFIAYIDLRGAFFNYIDKILPFLTTYLPLVYVCEWIPLLLYIKICIPLTFSVPPTYLPTSSCQCSLWTPPNCREHSNFFPHGYERVNKLQSKRIIRSG